jgi:hypothetical protein
VIAQWFIKLCRVNSGGAKAQHRHVLLITPTIEASFQPSSGAAFDLHLPDCCRPMARKLMSTSPGSDYKAINNHIEPSSSSGNAEFVRVLSDLHADLVRCNLRGFLWWVHVGLL